MTEDFRLEWKNVDGRSVDLTCPDCGEVAKGVFSHGDNLKLQDRFPVRLVCGCDDPIEEIHIPELRKS